MKKVFLLGSTLILSFALIFGLTGCDEKKDTFIIATEAGYAPFEYVGEGGKIEGVDIDISKAIAEKLGKELEIKNMAFKAALESGQAGKVDMVAACVTITDERKEKMDFSTPYFDSSQVAIVNVNEPIFEDYKKDELKDKIIGVQHGSVADTWVKEHVQNAKEVRKYDMLSIAASDLKQNKLDLIIADKLVAQQMIAKSDGAFTLANGAVVEGEQIGLAIPKGNDELLKTINEVIDELKANGKIDEFFKKHNEISE